MAPVMGLFLCLELDMAKMITEKTIADGGHDLETIDLAANSDSMVNPRHGSQFESIPRISRELKEKKDELQSAIDIAVESGVGEAGWIDLLVLTENGRTQRDKNKDTVNLLDYFKLGLSATGALQMAIDDNQNSTINVNAGTYSISSVSIPHSITFNCAKGTVFKRLDNIDIRQSLWNVGTAMFEIYKQGISVNFNGGPTFDGNKQNQLDRFKEPTGFSIKIQPPSPLVPLTFNNPTVLDIKNPKFINGTLGYLCIRGDNVNRRYLTKVFLDNPDFGDTLMGTGKGDPQAITALGYQPNYCVTYDYVHMHINNLDAEFSQNCGTGEYAPVAVLGTFFGNDYTQSGECSFFLTGTTNVKNMGRSGKLYNDDTNFLINNGIGAIDIYGKGETLYIENFVGKNNQNVSVRAKSSIANFTVNGTTLINCHRGIQVSASTTGASRAVVNIGPVTSYGGTVPQVEITGTSPEDRIPSATTGTFNFYGEYTNPEKLHESSHGNFHIRNVSRLTTNAPKVYSSPVCGIRLQDVVTAEIYSPVSRSDYPSILTNGVGKLEVFSSDLSSKFGAALSIQESVTPTVINISGGKINEFLNDAVLNLASNADITIDSMKIPVKTGNARGFSNKVGSVMRVSKCSVGAGVTTPIVRNGSRIFESGNSWNPNVQYGSIYLTSIGNNMAGDIVYNTAPIFNVGWICVKSGTPGSWEEFGSITT